jgi:glucosamine--fructose-6-phosphate aminotransferase (isomerizing)
MVASRTARSYGTDNMCGIIGYAGEADGLPVLTDGLKNLEYRGYDSAGVALRHGTSNHIERYKSAGEIEALRERLPDSSDLTVGVGHTRWSTHIDPTDAKAHPQADCEERVAVVHNGIIENYDEPKADLEARCHRFLSETDYEVVPHLVEEKLGDSYNLPDPPNASPSDLRALSPSAS